MFVDPLGASLKLYRFDASLARPIEQYGSLGAGIVPLLKTNEALTVVCIRLDANGVLGRHPAIHNQLFLVVDGAGEVSGEDMYSHPISAGQAAFWRAGEMHETRTRHGLTAIVIEGETVQPAAWMTTL